MQSSKNFVFLSISIFIGFITPSHAQVDTMTEDQFEDVSIIPQTLLNLSNTQQFRKVSPRGIGYPLESWGAAWGDFDADGYPDLWAGNHRRYATLYRNNRDGTFTDLLLNNKNEKNDGYDPTLKMCGDNFCEPHELKNIYESPSDSAKTASEKLLLKNYNLPINPRAIDKDSVAADSHGVAWADFDGDGDMDLFEITGGRADSNKSSNQLFENINNKRLVELTQQFDQPNSIEKPENPTQSSIYNALRYGQQAGRTPLWVDYDNDSRLDLVLSGFINATKDGKPPPPVKPVRLFRNTPTNGFVEIPITGNNSKGLDCPNLRTNFATLADLNDDRHLDLVCHDLKYPQKVYDMKNLTDGKFTEIGGALFVNKPGNVQDAIIADFDGDGENEIVGVRIDGNRNGARIVKDDTLHARLAAKKSSGLNSISLQGLDFNATGVLSLDLTSGHLGGDFFIDHDNDSNTDKLKITGGMFFGQNARKIPLVSGLVEFKGTLDPVNPSNNDYPNASNVNVQGFPVIDSLSPNGLYIGYDNGVWKFRIKNNNTGLVESAWMVLKSIDNGSAGMISNLTTVPAVLENAKFALSYLDKNNSNVFINRAAKVNLDTLIGCTSITAGDYDNDMDLDIFLTCENTPFNADNILYENLGDTDADSFPNFKAVTNAAGAAGTDLGIGKAVTMADYDVDGFLDLFVSNGHSGGSIPNGPDQVFRNRGNDNNWIQLDLVGLNAQGFSNIHGIGATVELSSNGVTQTREMNGGMHNYVQDHMRLHFGLANNNEATVKIYWPSGYIDEYTINPVNKLYKATENSGIEVVNLDKAESLVVDKDEQGYPHFDSGVNRGIFLWKESNGNKWRLRATGSGSQNTLIYTGNITANLGFDPANVEGIGIESNDTLDYTSDPKNIVFEFNVAAAQTDGINFDVDNSTVQSACLDVSGPDRVQVLLGKNQKAVQLPIDLVTLQPCIQQMCNGKTVTIVGTEGDDDGTANPSLVGTPGDDVIHGLGGNDSIDGLGGNDTICGGNGNDMIVGGSGKDLILAGSGNDNVLAGTGLDTIYGQAGNDILNGQSGNDLVNGGPGNDTLIGQNGDDTLNGNAGLDDLNGGSAIDICHGGADDDTTPNNSCETKISIP